MQQGITGSGTHRALTDGLIPLLLVEDTPTDSRLLHELLETAFPGRYLVEVAPSLATAEAAIAKQDYQAILLDLDLPDSRGIDTIKSLFKAARSIPIIVLTGLVDEGVAARAVRCGAQNYLQKGCADAASIAKAIRYAIDRKQQQWEQEALVAILRMANAHHQVRDLIRAVITFLQGWSGCEAVGIRLREGDDFPYFETRGFPAEFVEAENRLCAVDPSGELVRDSQGNPLIECMCGNVLCGRFDPSKPFFTAHGSFWSNGTTELLASTTEADRQARTRNRCNGEGYESVALIPMRADSVTFGLLQFNDRRKNRFTPALIGTLEHLGDNLAIALAHRRSAQMLQESERKYRGLFTEMFSGFALHEVNCDDVGRAVDYVTLEVNAAYESMLNVPASAVIGKKASELLPKEELEHWLGVFAPVALTGQSARYEMYSPSNQKHFEGAAYSPEKGKFAVTFADVTERKLAEDRLRQKHGLVTSVMETSPSAIVQVNEAGQIVYANRRAEEILGLTCSALLGRAYNAPEWKVASVNGGPFPDEELPFQVVQKTGKPAYGVQHAIEWPDGRRLILAINASPLMDRTGTFQGMVAAMEDVTERSQAALALKESEARYRDLFNAILDGFAVHEIILDKDGIPVDYRFLAVNPAFEQMTGFAAADVVGRTVMEVMPGTERHWVEAYGRVATTGVPTRFENYAEQLDKHFEVLAFQPRHGHFACVFRDITARKRAEDAIRESEQRYRSLVDNVGLGVVLVGDDYRIRSVNPAHGRLFGKAPEDFIGKECFREFEKRDTICPRCPGRVAMETGRGAEVETEGVRDDGRRHQARVQAFPILDSSGKASAFIEVIEDITERKRAEEAGRKSEEALKKAQQVAHLGSWVWHVREDRLEWSEEMYRIFGIDKATFTGSLRDVIAKAIHQEDRAKVDEADLRVIREKKPRPLEYRVIRADQTVRVVWAEAGELTLDEAGNAIALAGIVQDITDRKRAEERLRQTEAKMGSIFRVAPIGIGVVVNRVFQEVNDCLCRMTGYARDELVGHRSRFLYPSQDEFERVGRDKYGQIEEKGLGTVETQFMSKTGQTIDILLSSTPLDPTNWSAGVMFTAVDITERKRAQRERERLASAMEQANEVVVITNTEGGIEYANPAFERITGYTVAEAIGQNPRILKSDRQDEAFYRDLWGTLCRGETWQGRFVNRRKDGSLYTESAVISPVRNTTGQVVSYVAVKRDITEQLQLEQQYRQAQKMEAVGRLAAGVAHDFNNQLTVIQGYSDMLLSDRLEGDPLWEPLTQIRQAAVRAHATTSHLLSFSRNQILEAEVIDLNGFLIEAQKPISRMIGEDIRLVVAAAPNVPAVFIDKSGLHQALMNLVVNARDAMPRGGELVLRTSSFHLTAAGAAEFPDASPGDYVLLEVIDSGIGIVPQTLEHVFEPFFTTKEPGRGTGLGLPMVMGFVRQSKGFIGIRSEPGKGTAVRVLLPLVQRAAATSRSTGVSASAGAALGKTLMVVEDEAGVRGFLVRVLERSGYRVLAAAGPTEALKLASDHDGPIDLLISDMVMPEMRGDELASRLKESRQRLRVLFISGYIKEGASCEGELLRKPFKPADLLARVQSMLNRRGPRRKTKSGG